MSIRGRPLADNLLASECLDVCFGKTQVRPQNFVRVGPEGGWRFGPLARQVALKGQAADGAKGLPISERPVKRGLCGPRVPKSLGQIQAADSLSNRRNCSRVYPSLRR